MLKVQEWLHNQKGNFALLEEQLGVFACFAPEDQRVILNYNQIDSPKTNPIVRECRGLVLDSKSFDLISRSFYRFFNWGEHREEMEKFFWESCIGYHKEDGSLLNVYYWNGKWRINTRGSFGYGNINDQPITWQQLAQKAIGDRFFEKADPTLTYTFELCSLYNKVVRQYDKPEAFLLSAFTGEQELTHEVVENLAKEYGMKSPEANVFDDIADVQVYLDRCVQKDKTFEGIVIRDHQNRRFKVKSPFYIQLHRMINNGHLGASTERLIEIVLKNEIDEVLCYFPEIAPYILNVKNHIDFWRKDVQETYNVFRDMKTQKEFALAVQEYEYASILFDARKTGKEPEELFDKAHNLILKKLEKEDGNRKKQDRLLKR